MPGSSGHDTYFDIEFTIDREGCRVTPSPTNPRGEIIVLGASFTFGHGVADDENYPYLLAKNSYPDLKVENRAVSGWGTSHAFLMLEEVLQRDRLPAQVLYAMTPGHTMRNYIRRSWVRHITTEMKLGYDRRGHVHFELEEQTPVYQGIVDWRMCPEYSQKVRRMELDLTCAMLRHMQRMCVEKQVPFVVVLLPVNYGDGQHWVPEVRDWPQIVSECLVKNRIPTLGLTHLKIETFGHNEHPNAADHELLALSIGNSFFTKLLRLPPNLFADQDESVSMPENFIRLFQQAHWFDGRRSGMLPKNSPHYSKCHFPVN